MEGTTSTSSFPWRIVGAGLLVLGAFVVYKRFFYQPKITLDISEPDYMKGSVKYTLSLDGKPETMGTAVLNVDSGVSASKYVLSIKTKDRQMFFTVRKKNGEVAVEKTADFRMKK